jgi:predicted enzyme related to lactoylglutathione lyase
MNKRNIVHIEIPTRSGKESAEFYENLFGWHIEHDEEHDYTQFDPHDGPGGGFNPLSDNVKAGDVLIYVNSDDIEADLREAASLGGTIVMEKAEIPNIGWYGMFTDPTGNMIGLYTSMNPEFNR